MAFPGVSADSPPQEGNEESTSRGGAGKDGASKWGQRPHIPFTHGTPLPTSLSSLGSLHPSIPTPPDLAQPHHEHRWEQRDGPSRVPSVSPRRIPHG